MARYRIKQLTEYVYIIQKKGWFGWYNFFWSCPETAFSLEKAEWLLDEIKNHHINKKSPKIIKEIKI